MSTNLQQAVIPDEVRAFIATKPFHHEGLRKLATFLPVDDAELQAWLEAAAGEAAEGEFAYSLVAAALVGRKLNAELLPWALEMRLHPEHTAWIAWHMEGDVTGELLRGLELTSPPHDCRALCLFVAAAWWQKHRKGEEMPRQIARAANTLSKEKKLSATTMLYLGALALLLGENPNTIVRAGLGAKATVVRKQFEKHLAKLLEILNGPFEKFLHERQLHEFSSAVPLRRVSPKIDRNARCPCGSGKKYKDCCLKKGQGALQHYSPEAGMTQQEFEANLESVLTEDRLQRLRPAELLKLDAARVPKDLQAKYVCSLLLHKFLDEALGAFRILSEVRENGVVLPEHLHGVWSIAFEHAGQLWRPDIARALMEIFPDAEEKLATKANVGIRLLMMGHDPAKFMEALEKELRIVLATGDSAELQRIVWTVIESPYRALGLMLARSLLPIVEDKFVPALFEGILDARAKLELSPDDEFSDFMDERSLRSGRGDESAAMQEANDKLAAKAEELRRAKEERARLDRELKLQKRQERRVAAETKSAAAPDEEARKNISELKRKIDRLNALVSEGVKERVALRRDAQEKARENEELKAATSSHEANDGDAGETLEISGTQPVRLMEFPKEFAETLASFPRHVGRAAMNRLGRIASGEPGAFERVKQLKAYPEVLRARVSDKHRLLFSLTPDCVRVVDLIRRADLDRRIERLQASGLPPVD